MNHGDIDNIVKGLAPAVMAYLSKGLASFDARIKAQDEQIRQLAEANNILVKRFDELPTPEPIDLEAIAKLVEVPVAEKGKDAEPVDLDALAKAAAALVVVPEPTPGKDAEVDLDALAKAAAALVVVPEVERVDLEAVAALVKLPEVKDGKDAEPVDLEAVAALVKLPEPEKIDTDAIARAAAAMVPVPEVRQPQDGRDALHLEILPAIEETKTYARNTYAKHDGGLWRSFEQTSGMRGWECIVDGVASVNVVQYGDREFSLTLSKSSGHEVVQKFALPIQIYKGVHREGEAYEAHDNVTWAGSQWTSTKAENTDKPGTSDAWTLCVKAGRNGKDLRENASTFDASKGVKL